MWGRSVKVLIFPVLLSLVSIGKWPVPFRRLSSVTFMSVGGSISIPLGGNLIAFYAIYASTLATNIIATTLIAVKAWSACTSNAVLLLELTSS